MKTLIFIIICIIISLIVIEKLEGRNNTSPEATESHYSVLNVKDDKVYQEPKIEQNSSNKRLATVTAYTAIETCSNCITASGVKPFVGGVACPRYLPFGTQVRILGQIFFCNDRMNVRFPDRFDIFFGYSEEDYQRAKEFGIKKLTVEIL